MQHAQVLFAPTFQHFSVYRFDICGFSRHNNAPNRSFVILRLGVFLCFWVLMYFAMWKAHE
ncbi:MAG: hypothetical protein RR675_04000, partial [Oscillospiraceae bacterium]